MPLRRRPVLAATLPLSLAGRAAPAAQTLDWPRVERNARGQTVWFNAWGGSDRVNAYLQWAAGELQQRQGIKLEHVKLADTA
jgi:putative thiamine transport system substrate-binding protein